MTVVGWKAQLTAAVRDAVERRSPDVTDAERDALDLLVEGGATRLESDQEHQGLSSGFDLEAAADALVDGLLLVRSAGHDEDRNIVESAVSDRLHARICPLYPFC